MTEKEFIDWLRGFTEGVHHYNLTPKQWDQLKDKLKTVDSNKSSTVSYDQNYWFTTTT